MRCYSFLVAPTVHRRSPPPTTAHHRPPPLPSLASKYHTEGDQIRRSYGVNKHKLVAKAEAQSGKKASAKPVAKPVAKSVAKVASAPAVKSGLLLSHYKEGDSVIVTAWGGKYSGTVQKVRRRADANTNANADANTISRLFWPIHSLLTSTPITPRATYLYLQVRLGRAMTVFFGADDSYVDLSAAQVRSGIARKATEVRGSVRS